MRPSTGVAAPTEVGVITSANRRRWLNRVLRSTVDPPIDWIYWRLDLLNHGYPDHNKVLSSVAFFFGLVGLAIFGQTVVTTCAAVERLVFLVAKGAATVDGAGLGALVKACALMTAALLGYAALVFGMAFGLSGFRTWAKSRGGGTTEALGRVAAAAANPEVAARRVAGGNEYEIT
jgi:hypothetical protein